MSHKIFTVLFLSFFTTAVFAFVCEQAANIPLEKTQEQTATLGAKFSHIDQLQIIPQTFEQDNNQSIVKTVQILICGELVAVSAGPVTQVGGACQFDSNCALPMRCQNKVCVIP